VLYVEDEDNDVFFIKMAWERAGVEQPLQVVDNGDRAIKYLAGDGPYSDREAHPLPCLLLLDLNLPLKSGIEVLEWVREQPEFKTLPVVVYSSSGQEFDTLRTRQLGVSDYLVKQSNMAETIRQVQSLRQRFLDQSSA
jgi:DNA-binding response OmpR family regulator